MIVTKTITMERDVPRTTRELTVIYAGGRPLEDVEITLTDISTSGEDNDWQQWSVQRFGEISRETTDENGRVVLYYPQVLEGKPVQSLRLYLSGHPEQGVYFYANLNVPARADGNVIKFTPEDEPRTKGARCELPRRLTSTWQPTATRTLQSCCGFCSPNRT